MSIASAIAAIASLAKAIPQLAGFCRWAIDLLQKWEQKRNEVEAMERKQRKDATVREFIAAARRVDGVRTYPPREQQKADGEAGRDNGSSGGTGVR